MLKTNAIEALELKGQCQELRKLAEESGLTQQMLASALEMSQAQVSRILSGHVIRASRHFNALSIYVSRYRRSIDADLVRESQPLLAAVAEAWDGTPEHEQALAAVIRTLGRLQAPSRNRKE